MDDSEVVRRQQAQSGKVGYTKPVVIRGGPSKPTHFEVLPTFIPHTSGTEDLSLKLSYWKSKAGALRAGFPAEFTLTHDEVVALRDVINKGLGLLGRDSSTDYLVIPLGDSKGTSLNNKDVATVGQTLIELLARPEITQALGQLPNAASLIDGIQAATRIQALTKAIEELEEALSNGTNEESFYQDWCEKNCWAFGNAYTMRDEVRMIAIGDSVDLLMASTADELRDIFELKRPDFEVLGYDSGHKSYFWSRETSKTIGQCHRYLDALHEAARNGLRDHPELVAYYPYATVVIGRSKDWTDAQLRELHGLNMRLHGVRVMTYDHLLAQSRQTLRTLSEEDPEI
jgi:hypothetical protein